MKPDHLDYNENLLNLAAVIYRPENDIDLLLSTFAGQLQREGSRLGGVVQRNWRESCGPVKLMEVIDLMTGQAIPICQNLGAGSSACKLNMGGIAVAAQAVRRAVLDEVDLVIVNKFGKTEAAGGGLRTEIAEAVLAGRPVLTAVSERVYPAWREFTGGFGTTLFCDEAVIGDWWGDMTVKFRRGRRTLN